MAWLRSPKQFIKFIAIAIVLSIALFVILPTLQSPTSTNSSLVDDDVSVKQEQSRINTFNTTWDRGKNNTAG